LDIATYSKAKKVASFSSIDIMVLCLIAYQETGVRFSPPLLAAEMRLFLYINMKEEPIGESI
jgi:hypothetical protein